MLASALDPLLSDPQQPVPLPRSGATVSHLPLPLTPLVGRDREIKVVCDLLLDPAVRLVTLTGPGGVGKTRIALSVAESAQNAFPDGIWFVQLSTIHAPGLVATEVARALDVREAGRSLTDGIGAFLRAKDALLVLDNFEHVVAAAPFVAELLSLCPGVTCLITSRVRVHIAGEHVFPVPPLPLPPAAPSTTAERADLSPAVRLFLGCSRAAGTALTLSDDNADDIVAICRSLDGLPLAIELAAVRVQHMTLVDLRSRLAGDTIHTPLKMLTSGRRDSPNRHRTIRDTVAWSYALLGEAEQRVFRRLAVFMGGFDLEAAEFVCGAGITSGVDVLESLSILIDHNLVRRAAGPVGATRFDMLETIRHFCLEVLGVAGEEQVVRDAHASYFIAYAERAAPELFGSAQRAWLDRLEIEHANLRAVLVGLHDTAQHALQMRLSVALLFFWWFQGHLVEGRGWLDRVLANPGNGELHTHAWAVFGAALLANNLGDLDRGEILAAEAHTLALTGGQRVVEGMSLVLSAYVALARGATNAAVTLGESALVILREAGDDVFLANALGDVGLYFAAAGQVERGTALIEEALHLDRARGDRYLAGVRLSDRGVIAHDAGNHAKAMQCYLESVQLLADVGGTWYLASPCAGLAALSVTRDPRRSARLLGAAAGLRDRSGIAGWPTEQERDEQATVAVRAILGSEMFDRELACGRALPVSNVVAEALACSEPVESPSPSSGNLSSRERDVLRLLIAGRSDREIAETLFISPRTASRHVGAIISKLDVASRGEAAVVAIRNRLV